MKKLQVENYERQRILEMHGFLKEQDEKTQASIKAARNKEFFLTAIKNGCLTGNESNLIPYEEGDNNTGYKFQTKTKSGKIITFWPDMVWTLEGISSHGAWKCPDVKPIPVPAEVKKAEGEKKGEDTIRNGGEGKEIPKDPLLNPTTEKVKKDLSSISPRDLEKMASNAQEGVKSVFNIKSCEDLINIYFTQAQQGLYTDDLANRKKSIYACFNSFRSKMSDNTRDQLRWLSGNEENAKKLGLFRRYKNLGTIRDNQERSMFRLDRNFE